MWGRAKEQTRRIWEQYWYRDSNQWSGKTLQGQSWKDSNGYEQEHVCHVTKGGQMNNDFEYKTDDYNGDFETISWVNKSSAS